MAIAKIERVTFIAVKELKKEALRLFQAFQRVEIYQAAEHTVPVTAPTDDKSLRENLQLVEKAQSILSAWNKTSLIEKLRGGKKTLSLNRLEKLAESGVWRDICEKAAALDRDLQQNRARRAELARLGEQWSAWAPLSVNPREFSQLKRIHAAIGLIPAKLQADFSERINQAFRHCCFVETVFRQSDRCGVFVMYPKACTGQIREIFAQFEFSQIAYPFDDLPGEMIAKWQEESSDLLAQENDILAALSELSQQKGNLDLAEEYFRNLLIREEAKQFLADSKTSFLLNGWILSEDKAALAKLFEAHLPDAYYLAFEPLSPDDYQNAPIALKNGKIVSAFETLTEMYSMPAYDEIDPTPAMTPFYLVFFGMMVADIGYGLVVWLGTFFGRKLLRSNRELKKSLDFFYYLSYSIVVWGVIYGSFFGLDMPFRVFSPTTDIIPILIQSIVFGLLQIITALSISVYLHLKKKDPLGALSNGVAWIGLLVGLVLIVLSILVFKNQPLFYIAIAFCVISALLIVLVPVVQSKRHRMKGLMKGLYALYGATGYIGDLVSYTRLMALGIAGGSISIAFNTIVGKLPLFARLTFGVLMTLALHGLNLFLSMLGAYVHGIRLQYVEMFGKFYSGGGRKFNPFKTAEKHVYITDEQVEDNQ